MSKPPYKLGTKLGNVWVNVTNATHAYLEFGHNLNVDIEGPEPRDRRGPLTVRGVLYGGSVHVYQWRNGSWNIGTEFNERGGQPTTTYDRRNSLYMVKFNAKTYADTHASESARNAVSETVLSAFVTWAESHQDVFNVAGEKYRAEEREKRQEKIVELRKEINRLEAEIFDLSEKKHA